MELLQWPRSRWRRLPPLDKNEGDVALPDVFWPVSCTMDVAAMGAVDVKETASCFEIQVDVPGVKREEITVQVEDGNILTVAGERKRNGGEAGRYTRLERIFGRFQRRFRLPNSCQVEKTHASCKDGVLTVVVPRIPSKEQAKPKFCDNIYML